MAEEFLSDLEEDLIDDDFLDHDMGLSELSSSNAIHDHLQFQLSFDFDLGQQAQESHKRYQVDTYFFFPKSMGIDSQTFDRAEFYNSLTNYLRIRTPQMFSATQSIDNWSIPSADLYFENHLASHSFTSLSERVEQDVKLFACNINTRLKTLRKHVKSITKLPTAQRQDSLDMIEKHLNKTVKLLTAYRQKYMGKVRYQSYLIEDEVKMAFLLADEYLSYRLEAVLIRTYERLKQSQEPHDLMMLCEYILQCEMEYRESEQLIQLSSDSNEGLKETYYYRLGLLKKYISDVLYLSINNKRKDRVYRNLVAAAGAAVAALWAGLIDLQRFYWMQSPSPERDFAFRFFLIVVVGVVAYIFKDRIKELTRDYFHEKLKHRLPDFEFQMAYRYATAEGLTEYEVGRSREFMRYLKKESLPPEIRYIREFEHQDFRDPERSESILHYSKQVTLDLEKVKTHLHHLKMVRDLVRISVADFLEKLDEPKKNLHYFDRIDGLSKMKAPKVYHLNLIMRYSVWQKDDEKGWGHPKVEFERMRLILNKEGILRIESPLPRGELYYTQENMYDL